MARAASERVAELGAALRREVRRELEASGGGAAAALQRIDIRLAALEGAAAGAEAAQSEALRRVASDLSATLADAEVSLQVRGWRRGLE